MISGADDAGTDFELFLEVFFELFFDVIFEVFFDVVFNVSSVWAEGLTDMQDLLYRFYLS